MTARIAVVAVLFLLVPLTAEAAPLPRYAHVEGLPHRVDHQLVVARVLGERALHVFDVHSGAIIPRDLPRPCAGDPFRETVNWLAGGGTIAWTCGDPAWPDWIVQDARSDATWEVDLPAYFELERHLVDIGGRWAIVSMTGARGSFQLLTEWPRPRTYRPAGGDPARTVLDLDSDAGVVTLCEGLERRMLPPDGSEEGPGYVGADYARPWLLDRRHRGPGDRLRLRGCGGRVRTVTSCPTGCWSATMRYGWVTWASDGRLNVYRVRDGLRRSWALPRYRSGRWAAVQNTRTQVVVWLPPTNSSGNGDVFAAELPRSVTR
jgi:hypothetical protein